MVVENLVATEHAAAGNAAAILRLVVRHLVVGGRPTVVDATAVVAVATRAASLYSVALNQVAFDHPTVVVDAAALGTVVDGVDGVAEYGVVGHPHVVLSIDASALCRLRIIELHVSLHGVACDNASAGIDTNTRGIRYSANLVAAHCVVPDLPAAAAVDAAAGNRVVPDIGASCQVVDHRVAFNARPAVVADADAVDGLCQGDGIAGNQVVGHYAVAAAQAARTVVANGAAVDIELQLWCVDSVTAATPAAVFDDSVLHDRAAHIGAAAVDRAADGSAFEDDPAPVSRLFAGVPGGQGDGLRGRALRHQPAAYL